MSGLTFELKIKPLYALILTNNNHERNTYTENIYTLFKKACTLLSFEPIYAYVRSNKMTTYQSCNPCCCQQTWGGGVDVWLHSWNESTPPFSHCCRTFDAFIPYRTNPSFRSIYISLE